MNISFTVLRSLPLRNNFYDLTESLEDTMEFIIEKDKIRVRGPDVKTVSYSISMHS